MTAVAIVLAAGEGRRLGGVAKALLPAGDASFLAQIVRTAGAGGAPHALVVAGPPHGAAVAAAADALGVPVVVNPAPERGMASSVELGFRAAAARGELAGVDVALLWPVDHPYVAAPTVAAVLAALAAAPDALAAIPVRSGRGGHPPAIRRALWPALVAASAHPDGARGVLAAAAPRVVRIAVDDPGVLRDVDVPGDVSPAERR